MKHIIRFICLFSITVALAACSSRIDEKAVTAYIEASENMVNMKTADFTIGIRFDLDIEEIGIRMSGAYDAREDMQLNMQLKADAVTGDNPSIVNVYIKDNIMYMEREEEKTALSLPVWSMASSFLQPMHMDKNTLMQIIDSAEIKNEHVLLTIDSDKAKLNAMFEELGMQEFEDMEMQISDMKFDLLLHDGFLSNMVMDFEISANNVVYQSIQAKIHVTFGFTNINQERNIEFPDLTQFPPPDDMSDLDYI